ncbi:MAG: ComF family protein [Candidatus Daviesbacteria bacterium]|nr:MAG: ComF family protein [Candidatus Daviesbacteria bacterium]
MLLDLLFPKKCVSCARVGSYLCQGCINNLNQSDLVCPKCERLSLGGQTHPICWRKFGLDGLWFLGVYQDPLKKVIQVFKYKFVKGLGDLLVELILEYWARYQPFVLDRIKADQGKNWLVVSVPLHWYRQNWRDFNQAEIIGKNLSQKLGLGFADALIRNRYTKPQARLKAADRKSNIFGAFSIKNSSLLSSHPNILLIDDVWTTGSTLKECGYILKRNGAKEVWALTLAR